MKKVKVNIDKKNINQTKEKIKKNRFLLYTLLLIIIIIVIVLINNFKKFGVITLPSKNIDYYNYIDVNYENNTIIEKYKNEILIANQGKIYTVNGNGKITWQVNLADVKEPIISIRDKYIVVGNKNASNYYIFKNKKQIVNNKVNGNIKQVSINSNGRVAMIFSGEGYKSILQIFDNNSKNIYKKFLKSDIINNIYYSDNNNEIFFTELEIKGTSTNAYLNKIDIKNKKSDVENLYKKENDIVYKMSYNMPKIYLNLTNSIQTIYLDKIKTNVTVDLEQKQLLFIDNDKNYYSYVYKNSEKDSKDKLDVYTLDNKLVTSCSLDITPKNYSMNDGVICIASDKKIVLYNYFGKIIKVYNSKANITKTILFNDGKSLLIKIANKIYIENL